MWQGRTWTKQNLKRQSSQNELETGSDIFVDKFGMVVTWQQFKFQLILFHYAVSIGVHKALPIERTLKLQWRKKQANKAINVTETKNNATHNPNALVVVHTWTIISI